MSGESVNYKKGDMVIVSDKTYGSYIGRFVEKHNLLQDSVKIQVLACIGYPSQTTILHSGLFYERRPFAYGSVNTFDLKNVQAYTGSIPCYGDSVKSALDKAIYEARQQGNVNIAVKLRNHLLDIA